MGYAFSNLIVAASLTPPRISKYSPTISLSVLNNIRFMQSTQREMYLCSSIQDANLPTIAGFNYCLPAIRFDADDLAWDPNIPALVFTHATVVDAWVSSFC